jgi:DNA-binding NarL/FixJ family response regulator
MMRVLLADDKVDLRSALRLLLEQEPGVELIDEVSDIDGLLAQVNRLHPDLLLLDWELTDIDTTGAGQRLLHVLHGQYPHLSVIVLSGRPESNRSVLAAGAHSFVSKSEPPDRLLSALHRVQSAISQRTNSQAHQRSAQKP